MNKIRPTLSAYSHDLQILWRLSAVVSLVVVVGSFFLTIEDLDSGVLSFLSVPHEHCLLCGMSHSMILMSDWRFEAAFSWNSGGPFLYVLMVVNGLLGFAAIARDIFIKNHR